MKFIVRKTSDSIFNKGREIELNTLEEFIDWINKQEFEVIVYDNVLEIYDDYRE